MTIWVCDRSHVVEGGPQRPDDREIATLVGQNRQAKASARCRTLDQGFVSYGLGGVVHGWADVFGGQVRLGIQQISLRRAFGELAQQQLNPDPRIAYHWFTQPHGGVDVNSTSQECQSDSTGSYAGVCWLRSGSGEVSFLRVPRSVLIGLVAAPGFTGYASVRVNELPAARRLDAIAWARPMTPGTEGGSSEPHVFDTDHGHYMVKLKNNPQGARVLVNEFIAGLCLGVRHPCPAVVNVDQSLIDSSPGAKFNSGAKLEGGLAFGSELWQSDPQGAVDPALITNKEDVAGTLAVDTWLSQNDSRQYRVRAAPAEPGKYEYIPLDHGHIIGSPAWTAAELDARPDPTLANALVPVTRSDLEAALARLREFTAEHARNIVGQVPPEWISDQEREALERYLTRRADAAAELLDKAYPSAAGAAA